MVDEGELMSKHCHCERNEVKRGNLGFDLVRVVIAQRLPRRLNASSQ